MDRELLERGLAEAEQCVAKAERHLVNQLEFVARLERDGCDPSQAMQLLQHFEELQALHVADRDRLRKQLGFESDIVLSNHASSAELIIS
jgi:hypothetical protein